MTGERYLLVPAEGHIDEDDGMTKVELINMLALQLPVNPVAPTTITLKFTPAHRTDERTIHIDMTNAVQALNELGHLVGGHVTVTSVTRKQTEPEMRTIWRQLVADGVTDHGFYDWWERNA